ncbi:MAG: glucose-1-phosphate adenylyltransferase [Nitrospirae bacterium CG18_big_fil_WC_8_21_14_2_50_70_55]|nr:glucose-1-phosphate adenylyltransferase [Deltaproteobacteria bacterium]OIP62269.1 MAG: glucose-1-phosphate adenylyltransferase [Nitrospirae bacterium CG2_30_70_394]PIQ05693.1 MAG: glucose-1-phosphate adenylyltransferase [Nitrospirae bacterium CG18_big_fil_WC_8_21_14_2_50_70_55]PIU79506.1 MAG: glucose-1-phosphate adenylyltransferase [Nitrospirae bacterium CG06_land_8_20_14_3_00_70_43]PIW83822.1 MAG: glucose-1-phosphate adenylyltransferase [Nitrospirae bacterium CG_4_8_14_3_um_filter_70_85]PI
MAPLSVDPRNVLSFVLAGGRGNRLDLLTEVRSKPSVPFGGKYRIIDFTLSNCINSELRRIAVLTQYKSSSLAKHIRLGWSPNLSPVFGEFVVTVPPQQKVDDRWYVGTADAIHQNLDIIRENQPRFVLILSGDHIYKMDYRPLLVSHVRHAADLTVVTLPVPRLQATAFGVIATDPEEQIVDFVEKPVDPIPIPGEPNHSLVSMGVYCFTTDALLAVLEEDAADPTSSHDFGKDVLPRMLGRYRLFSHPFRDARTGEPGYWRDVGTVGAYYEANMDLVAVSPQLNLYDPFWRIHTYQEDCPPAKFVFADEGERAGVALDSLVSGGCIVSGGRVVRSILASRVRINSYAEVRESLLLGDNDVGRHCRIRRAIIDRCVNIPANTVIGYDEEEDRKRFRVVDDGICLVTADAQFPTLRHPAGTAIPA